MILFSTALKKQNIDFIHNASAKDFCSFRLGGKISYLVFPQSEKQLKSLFVLLHKYNFSFYVLGNGSNTLFSEKIGAKVVISLAKMPQILVAKGCSVDVSAQTNLFCLHKFLKDSCLGGLEFAFGIPASVGGAIKCNAGAFGGNICDFVENITIFNTKTLKKQKINRENIIYSYRKTNIEGIILRAQFKLFPSDFISISTLQNKYYSIRRQTQPSLPSAGSIFKRDGEIIPAKLIDETGLKGLQVGGAAVSDKHAGFIVKTNESCTSGEVIKLIKIIKKTIKSRYKIDLKEEIIII